MKKWRARKVVESLLQCQAKIIDKCYISYMYQSKTVPTVVFLDRTSKWPGLIGQSRNLNNELHSPSLAGEEDMTRVATLPRSRYLCNSLELVDFKNPCFGDRVLAADTLSPNFTEFLSRFSKGALRSLSGDPAFPPP